ncbi:hypothetical protein A5685_01580 [Mycobacterium colombiense]|uniref:Uncharacterized protein n=1 Tax=Mycobacterium colombiense TaxID=339268 RepID=A0A1A2SH53_9MYCO|nr:hypothetical protein A5685_01580 [Mycobacterium colombiense]
MITTVANAPEGRAIARGGRPDVLDYPNFFGAKIRFGDRQARCRGLGVSDPADGHPFQPEL